MAKLKSFMNWILGRQPAIEARKVLDTAAAQASAGYTAAHKVLDDSSARLDQALSRMELLAVRRVK
jgi:hypothetical protein